MLAARTISDSPVRGVAAILVISRPYVQGVPKFAVAHPEIPWAQMRGMRNRMVHGYLDINLDDTTQQRGTTV